MTTSKSSESGAIHNIHKIQLFLVVSYKYRSAEQLVFTMASARVPMFSVLDCLVLPLDEMLQSVLCITANKYLVCVLVVLLHARFSVVSPILFLLAAIFWGSSLLLGYACGQVVMIKTGSFWEVNAYLLLWKQHTIGVYNYLLQVSQFLFLFFFHPYI